jgi:hypothetical protein
MAGAWTHKSNAAPIAAFLKIYYPLIIMSDIMLKCGCIVTEEGDFIVGQGCKQCKECNAVGKLHPFGDDRIIKIETR